MKKYDFTYSILWNALLVFAGSLLFAFAVKAIAQPHGLITGGLSGLAMLIHYLVPDMSTGVILLGLNIPLFLIAWYFMRSRRLLLYSLFGMLVMTFAIDVITYEFAVESQLYAAIAAGIVAGAGGGLIFRSLGAGGGMDLIAILVHRRFNIGIGRFLFGFNLVLFSISIFVLKSDPVIASLVLVFIMSAVLDSVLGMFNQRKMCFIISDKSEEMSKQMLKRLRLGGTWLQGSGLYSGRDKRVLMTVISNYHLKRLEELVFGIDPSALFIVENTFSVLGSTFSKRREY